MLKVSVAAYVTAVVVVVLVDNLIYSAMAIVCATNCS